MVKELSRDQYLATFVPPMRRLAADDESYKPIPLGDYVAECIQEITPPPEREQLQIQHVYLNDDQSFYHVLIDYGLANQFLVIVVDCKREIVFGHFFLDLNDEYGLHELNH